MVQGWRHAVYDRGGGDVGQRVHQRRKHRNMEAEAEAEAETWDGRQKRRGWVGTVGGRRVDLRPSPLVCVSVRDEERGSKIIIIIMERHC